MDGRLITSLACSLTMTMTPGCLEGGVRVGSVGDQGSPADTAMGPPDASLTPNDTVAPVDTLPLVDTFVLDTFVVPDTFVAVDTYTPGEGCLRLAPVSTSFGQVEVGVLERRGFVLRNCGDADLRPGRVFLAAPAIPGFGIESAVDLWGVGTSQQLFINVSFTPTTDQAALGCDTGEPVLLTQHVVVEAGDARITAAMYAKVPPGPCP